METLSARQAVDLLSDSPLLLGTLVNQEGQNCTFYVDETNEGFIFVEINNIFANTGFFDLDDMIQNHGEYTPILNLCNEIECGFEYYNYGECKELHNSFIYP
jgi:hypothetical protein